jgi:hypothetical protein
MDIHLIGFDTEEHANEIGALVSECLTAVASELNLDLDDLDGVTVAHDYARALAELDRGFVASKPLTPTSDLAEGIAMTPAVQRGGCVKAHIVLHAGIPESLKSEDEATVHLAIYLLAHEAAHVHDLTMRKRAFPGVLLNQQLSGEDGYLFQAADACWDEYAACRLSARIYPEQVQHFETVFCDALAVARERANLHLARYWQDRNHTKAFSGVYSEYSNLLKYASYLIGHIDGTGSSLAEVAPRAHDMVQRTSYFAPFLAELAHCLDTMWQTRETWAGIDVYDPVKTLVRKLVRNGGVEMSTVPQGLYVRILSEPGMLPT